MSDVAIVSGGGNGIGRCVALRFAQAGIAVAIADADQEAAERVVSELVAEGAQARSYSVDVLDILEDGITPHCHGVDLENRVLPRPR